MELHVIYTPDADGGRWTARVKGKVNGTGCGTWGRSLSQARMNIREAIATALEDDAAAEAAVLREEYELPNTKQLADLRARREKLDAIVRALAGESEEFARELQRQGFSTRDIAELIGMSHQRVQQWLAQGGAKTRKRARVAER